MDYSKKDSGGYLERIKGDTTYKVKHNNNIVKPVQKHNLRWEHWKRT